MKHVLLTVVFLGIACVAMAHELSSPNGNLKLNVVLDSEGGPVYSLYYKGEPVVEPSALGILMEEADLSNGFRILDATNSTLMKLGCLYGESMKKSVTITMNLLSLSHNRQSTTV